MPPLNVLFLALLGGFVFVTRWYPTRYYTLRAESYRLLFTSAVAGAVFLLLSTCLVTLGVSLPRINPAYHWCHGWWRMLSPPTHSGKATLAFLMGSLSWWPVNMIANWAVDNSWFGRWKLAGWFSDKQAVERAIRYKNDPLEMLLRTAMGQRKMVAISLKGGKVYIGFISTNFNPAFETESIRILPSQSGYRETESKRLHLTVNYSDVYQKITDPVMERINREVEEAQRLLPSFPKELLEEEIRERIGAEIGVDYFEVILPVDEIQSVNIFDERIYEEHFSAPIVLESAPQSLSLPPSEVTTIPSTVSPPEEESET